jgi:hypothetical protein
MTSIMILSGTDRVVRLDKDIADRYCECRNDPTNTQHLPQPISRLRFRTPLLTEKRGHSRHQDRKAAAPRQGASPPPRRGPNAAMAEISCQLMPWTAKTRVAIDARPDSALSAARRN